MDTDYQAAWRTFLHQPLRPVRPLLTGLALAAACYLVMQLGVSLTDPRTQVIPVFPAAGFTTAVLLLLGWRRAWFWLALGMWVHMFLNNDLARFWLIAAGNTAAMLVAALLTERYAGGARFLERPRHVFGFVFFGAGGFGLCSAVVGMTVLTRLGLIPWGRVGREGMTWAVADIVGVLLVAPPLLAWSEHWRSCRQALARWAEMLVLLLVIAGVTQFSFGGWPFRHHEYSLEYLAIPMLIWAAFRFPRCGGVTVTLVVAGLAIANALADRGTFALHHPAALSLLQVYLGSVSMLVLVIAAGAREHEAQTLALHRAFSEAEAARGAAEQADRAKGAFLSRMSHELRTPLNAILGFSQILQLQGKQDEVVADCSTHILDAGRHLLSLVNEVLDLATLNRGRMELSPEPVEMAPLVRECLGQLAEQAREHQISLRLEGPGTGPQGGGHPQDEGGMRAADDCVVLADRARLRQVMCHLLANAVRYNVEGGRVTVSFVRADRPAEGVPGQWRIRVADTGRGISAEDQRQLFNPFQRLGAERTDQEGTGLGLAVSKSLIEAMAGRLGLESTPGEGSVFWVELPATGRRQIETAPARPERATGQAGKENESIGEAKPAAASEQNRTILYVEDNSSNLQLVRSAFERYFPGLRLLSARNGREGLRMAQGHRPGLILLDVQLPDIDGDVVLLRLRANADTRDIPVVILSADATPASRQRLLGAGAQEYLTKPLEIPPFLMLIDRVFQAGAKIPHGAG